MPFQKSVSLTAADQKPTCGASFNRFESLPANLAHETITLCESTTQVSQHCIDKSQESGSSDCDSNGVHAYECCCSEKCSIIDIASGNCPTPKSTSSHFPLLAAQHLSESERGMLCGHLRKQFQEISRKYARLVQSIRKSLKNQGVKAVELTEKLVDLKGFIPLDEKAGHPLLQDRIPDMKKAETTDEVFSILSDYNSFFNHDIIEYIVDELGTDTDLATLEKYKNDFTEYCRRSVFECPFSICSKRSSHFVDLVMKVVSDSMIEPYSMEAIQLFRVQVATLLHITKYALKLCSVESGCLQLTFQIPHCLSSILFPLSADQRKGLMYLGVTNLVCDGVSKQVSILYISFV